MQVPLRMATESNDNKSKKINLFSKAELDEIFKPELAKDLLEKKEKKEMQMKEQTVTSRPNVQKTKDRRDPLN